MFSLFLFGLSLHYRLDTTAVATGCGCEKLQALYGACDNYGLFLRCGWRHKALEEGVEEWQMVDDNER